MTSVSPPVLEFPAFLHGSLATTRRRVRAESHRWTREFLQTGGFTLPERMRPVLPGEVVVTHMGAEFLAPDSSWRLQVFIEVFPELGRGLPAPERQRIREAFEAFCLNSPWGALHYCVAPPPKRSAENMARRLTALMRFWEVLESPRYAFWFYNRPYKLEDLVHDIYGRTLEAWCPDGPPSVREHLSLTVELMARATRQDCEQALLRLAPVLIQMDPDFKHLKVLSDLDFLRERFASLSPRDFDSVSSAYMYTVTSQLADWDRELDRR